MEGVFFILLILRHYQRVFLMDGPDLIVLREEQFKSLFETFKKPLHDYVSAITGSHDIAEELTQEAFTRLWKKMGTSEAIDNADQYLFRIARNLSMDFFKKTQLDVRLQSELGKQVSSYHPVTDQLDLREAEGLIHKAVEALPPQRKKVYQLSRQQGMKLEEIAEQLSLSKNTTKNHLIIALRQIRDFYNRHHSKA